MKPLESKTCTWPAAQARAQQQHRVSAACMLRVNHVRPAAQVHAQQRHRMSTVHMHVPNVCTTAHTQCYSRSTSCPGTRPAAARSTGRRGRRA
eukprot:641667-Pelagomonas_calceolata.AAC.4